MSLTAADRFGGEDGAAPSGRRMRLFGVSLGLHGLALLGMLTLGQHVAERHAPPEALELMFEAPAALEAAVVTAAREVTPSAAPQPVTPPAPASASVAPVQLAPLPAPPPLSTAAVSPSMASLAEPAAAVSVPSAERGEIQRVEPPPVEAHPAPVVRRPAPVRPTARPVQERTLARPAPVEAPLAALPAAVSAPVAAPPTPVRMASISTRWQGELAGWIRSRTRYPDDARQRGEQGAVLISFTVGRDGQVLDASLRQRSGSDALDQAALAMFRAARVPAFPPEMDAAQVTISVPVRYRLEQ